MGTRKVHVIDARKGWRPERVPSPIPDLSGFRAALKIRRKALSQSVREARRSSRY